MKRGDRVRVVGIPLNLPEGGPTRTRALFERCVGQIFVIADVRTMEGRPHELLELEVGQVVGKPSSMESIWIEPRYIEPVT